MKILKGALQETIYGWPCQRSTNRLDCATAPDSLYPSTQHTCNAADGKTEPNSLVVQRDTTYKKNGVTYMSDRLGLHRICNPDLNEVAVSLHLYTVSHIAVIDSRTSLADLVGSHQTLRSTVVTSLRRRQERKATCSNATSIGKLNPHAYRTQLQY